jgi:hypothetical protein
MELQQQQQQQQPSISQRTDQYAAMPDFSQRLQSNNYDVVPNAGNVSAYGESNLFSAMQ